MTRDDDRACSAVAVKHHYPLEPYQFIRDVIETNLDLQVYGANRSY